MKLVWQTLRATTFGLLLAGGLVQDGCASQGTDSNTSWFKRCDSDQDCNGELVCLCGACSRACASNASCKESSGVCLTIAGGDMLRACGADSVSLCALPCNRSSDCGAPNECLSGACLPPPPPLSAPDASVPESGSTAGLDASPDVAIVLRSGCPAGLAGPALVEVPTPPGAPVTHYCIESTEVTNAQYNAFLAATVPTSGQDAWCSWNDTYGTAVAGKDDRPVGGVDWCDAFAYCKWAGKRLCGKITAKVGGEPNAYDALADATKSEWFNACSRGGSRVYPYGDTYDPFACSVTTGPVIDGEVPVGSLATCEGGYPGVYDLSSNFDEWEDSCSGYTSADGRLDYCRIRGGNFAFGTSETLRCDAAGVSLTRDASSGLRGFRCCADAL